MTTNTLTRYAQDGLEIYINHQTGESFASIRGYARMAGKAESTIRERISKGGWSEQVIYSEVLTPGGLQGARLLNENMIVEWLPSDNPTTATQLLKLGVRLFMHKLAGYTHAPAQPQLPTNYVEALEALLNSEKQKLALSAQVQQQSIYIDELKPKAQAAEILLESKQHLTMQEAAQLLNIPGIGRNKLFEVLKKLGYLITSKHPYQKFVDMGIFVVRESISPDGIPRQQILITQKGIQYLIPRLAERGYVSSKLEVVTA